MSVSVSHTELRTLTIQPHPLPISAYSEGSYDSPSDSPSLHSHIQELSQVQGLFIESWKRFWWPWVQCSKLYPEAKRKLKYLTTKASSSIGSNFSSWIFGHSVKKNLWLIYLSLIIFSDSSCLGGWLSWSMAHFKVSKRTKASDLLTNITR